jgi:hypothetical protein
MGLWNVSILLLSGQDNENVGLYVVVPSFILEKERVEVFERSVELIRNVHRKAGFGIEE